MSYATLASKAIKAGKGLFKYFTDDAVEKAVNDANAYKSREMIVEMPIDTFLKLAKSGKDPEKAAGVKDLEKFNSVPYLTIDDVKDGVGRISQHEGRHRARELLARGEKTMPVRIKSHDIRWDMQHKGEYDFVDDFPVKLTGQKGSELESKTINFPISQGQSGVLIPEGSRDPQTGKAITAAVTGGLLATQAEAGPLGLLSKGNKVRAYRGGSPRIWTEEGEMSTVGGKLGSDEAGAFLSSNPRTASTYAKTGKEGSQVAPVDLDTSDFITIDPPKGQINARWNNLSPDSVITFTDGKKMTIAEALPDYKYMGKQLDTNLVATLLRTHPMVKGKGVAFNNIQDRGPQVWGATAEEIKDFGAKAFEPQTSYAVWDESAMKGAFAKNEGPGFMNGLVLPVTAGGTVTMMAAGGDDAEAAPLPVTIGRLLQLGFLKADSAGNPSAVKAATTRYNKTMKADRRFAANERIAQANEYEDFLRKYELDAPRQELDLVDLEGKPIMGILSDRSMKGEIDQVAGIPLESTTYSEGGMMFPRAHQDMDAGWMSMYTTAKPVQQKIIDIAEETGESPIVLPMAMGENATNFATPVTDIMFKQVMANPPKKAAIKQFDAELRKFYPDWVGLNHPGAYDQLMGVGDFPMEGAGKMRTAFSTIMGKAEYRNQGFPSYNAALNAVNDPAFKGMPIGTMGFTSFKGMPDVDAYRQLGLHGSYDTVIPGQYSGATELPFFAREIFSDAYKHLDVEMTKPKKSKKTGKTGTPRPFTEEEKINAIATRGAVPENPDDPITSYEMMTPKRIDELGAAMERKKELAKKYGTYGAALLGLGGTGSVMAEPAAQFSTEQPPQDDFDRLVGMVTKRKPQPQPQPQPVMADRDPLDVSPPRYQKQNASFGGLAKDTAGAFGTGLAKGTVDLATNLPRDVGGLIGMMPFMDSQKAEVVGGLLNSINAPVREKMVVPDYEPSYMMSDEERDKVQGFGALIPGLLF